MDTDLATKKTNEKKTTPQEIIRMPRWYRIFLLHVLRAGPTQERVKRSAPE
jgi:hypothetical protein